MKTTFKAAFMYFQTFCENISLISLEFLCNKVLKFWKSANNNNNNKKKKT